ncbi:Aste57867_3111 [Aphanomyces stellatus]|uniref:Aste57867_3111 protein n=1 Tax=Aphanomyces stellatus TaxID=120398 RepID=A0A485KA14_9STRA|nr:hypothetical protein As57867_003102 [Aphanomyces stellatus]VFT80287.1 Aste57867_3111 [Aphanomyces stellatus]
MGKAAGNSKQTRQQRSQNGPPLSTDSDVSLDELLVAAGAPTPPPPSPPSTAWRWYLGVAVCFTAVHAAIAFALIQDADPGYYYSTRTRYSNIGNIDFATDAPFMGYPPIDVVYTWVNGSDPRWKKDKDYWHRRWKAQINGEIFDETDESMVYDASAAATENRFRDNEELRYSLRSIEMYAPWVRHVYLVTDGQIPNWLNVDAPRLTIVPHRAIFANQSHLPVFSSPAIEANLDNIPGLSSMFLYFNDDVFLGAPVVPEDFISPSGVQNIYLSWEVPECSAGCREPFLANGHCDPQCNNTMCAFDMGDCGCREVPTEDPLVYDVVCDPPPPPSTDHTTTTGDSAASTDDSSTAPNALNCVDGCSWTWIGDGSCDHKCNVTDCAYDGGDCSMDALTLLPSVNASSHPTDVPLGVQVPRSVNALVVYLGTRFEFLDKADLVNEDLVRRAVMLEESMTLVLVFARPDTTGHVTAGASIMLEGEKDDVPVVSPFTLLLLRGERAFPGGVFSFDDNTFDDLRVVRRLDASMPALVDLTLTLPFHALDDWSQTLAVTNSWQPAVSSLCPQLVAPMSMPPTEEADATPMASLVQIKRGGPPVETTDDNNAAAAADAPRCRVDARDVVLDWQWVAADHDMGKWKEMEICMHNGGGRHCMTALLSMTYEQVKWVSPVPPKKRRPERLVPWTGEWNDGEDCVLADWLANAAGAVVGECSPVSTIDGVAAVESSPPPPSPPVELDPEIVKKAKAMCSTIARRLKTRGESSSYVSNWVRDALLSAKQLVGLHTLEATGHPHHHILSSDDVAACEAYFTANPVELPSPPKDDHAAQSTDTFGDSLRFVNKLYNAKFGKIDGLYRRRVPSHMPHFIQKKYLTEMKGHWAAEFNATSSHRFRHPKDMQFSFSYMYYVVNRHKMHPPTIEDIYSMYIDVNGDQIIDEHEALSVASLLTTGEHPSEDDIAAVKACITPDRTNASREEVRRDGKVLILESTQPYLTLESLRACENVSSRLIQTAMDRLPPTHAMMSEKQVTFHMLSDQYRTAWNQLLNTRAKRTKFVCINDDMKYPSVAVSNILNDLFTSLWPHRSQFELPYHLKNRYGHVDELAAAHMTLWIVGGVSLVFLGLIVFACVYQPPPLPVQQLTNDTPSADKDDDGEASSDDVQE